MKKYLYLLTMLNIHLLTATKPDVKPGDPVVLTANQKMVSFMNLTERPKPGDMVIIKGGTNYRWGRVHDMTATNLNVMNDDGSTSIAELYGVIHKRLDRDTEEGAHHSIMELYKLQELE